MRTSIYFCGALLALTFVSTAAAQDQALTDSDSVVAVVTQFYSALSQGDSATVQNLFHPQALLFTSLESAGETAEAFTSVAEFVRVALEPPPGWWSVQLIEPVIHVSNSVAVVWSKFVYQAPNQHRCGVETQHLARIADRWQIVSIANQSQHTGCERIAGSSP